jgi:hypothetical protein
MTAIGKSNILGILTDAVDYKGAAAHSVLGASGRRSMAVSALAAHAFMSGVLDSEHEHCLNHFDLLAADVQPVAWA